MAAVPQDLLDRIRAVERQVRELSGRAQMRPALNRINHGIVTIGEGGQLIVRAPSGHAIFGTGQAPQGDWYVTLAREDGTAAVQVGANTYDGDDIQQMVRIFDRAGHAIVMDDYYADGYLGRPSIPIPMHATAGQQTSNSSPTVAWTGGVRIMNAVLNAAFETWAPKGTTAEIEFEGDGDVLDSWTVKGGGWTSHQITAPVRWPFMEHVTFRLRHRVSAGSGSVQTNCLGVYTRNTLAADEAPEVIAARAPAEQPTPDGQEPEHLHTLRRPGLHRVED
ncbi:hypothetical protein [Streptomyces cacaoi]|uniref:hypothetical protein n=1 Tax=Streptomyces cacaoi TaxID=1898 RepID=UPI00374A621E